MKKKFTVLFMVLFLSQMPLIGQPDTTMKMLRQKLQTQFVQLKKTLQCALGKEGCTGEEIVKARILVGKIIVGLVVITGGTVLLAKKGMPAWKLRKKLEEARKRTQEEFSDYLTTIKFDQLANDQQDAIFYHYLVNKDIPGLESLLAEKYPVRDEWVDVIKTELKNKKNIEELYLKLQALADDNFTLQFQSSYTDKNLWSFFKSHDVISPAKKAHESFYEWGGGMEMGPIGPSKPQLPKSEQPLTIGDR